MIGRAFLKPGFVRQPTHLMPSPETLGHVSLSGMQFAAVTGRWEGGKRRGIA